MSRRIIECDSCGREKQQYGKEPWCHACWNRWDRAGQPGTGPPPRTTGRWQEYAELTREQHFTLEDAAVRMGVSHRTAQRYEAWLREAGIPAPAYRNGQYGTLPVFRKAVA